MKVFWEKSLHTVSARRLFACEHLLFTQRCYTNTMIEPPLRLPIPTDRLRKMFIGVIIMNAVIGVADMLAAFVFIYKKSIEHIALTQGWVPVSVLEKLTVSPRGQFFAIFYFISHGIIKLALANALLRNRLWAYPVAIVFFGLFSLYQIYVLLGNHTIFEFILFVVNVSVLISVSFEYRRITQTKAL